MKKKADWKILSACLVVAIIFWLLHAMGRNYLVQVDFPIKIELSSKIKNKKLSKNIPTTIKIEVTSKGWDLLRFNIIKITPILITVNRSRTWYITRNELTKAAKSQIKHFKVEKVLTKNVKLY